MIPTKYVITVLFVCLLLAALASPAFAHGSDFPPEIVALFFAVAGIIALSSYSILNFPIKCLVLKYAYKLDNPQMLWLCTKSWFLTVLLSIAGVPAVYFITRSFLPVEGFLEINMAIILLLGLIPDARMFPPDKRALYLFGANAAGMAAVYVFISYIKNI